jgi:hypothetical protein
VSRQDYSDPPRRWPIVLPTAILVALAVAWSAFWYLASSKAQETMTGWRAREANAGRIYGCADTSFGGYPFRIEVACEGPSMDDRAGRLSIRARHLAAVAQVWDPTLVIGEIAGPMTLAPLGGSPTVAIDWMLAQASLRGTPGAPERLSIAVDQPSLSSVPASEAGPLVKAEHAEFHARFAAQSTPGHPALDVALSFAGFTAPAFVASLGPPLGGIASATTDVSIVGVLHDAPDLSPKPLDQRLREFQAANGQLEITNGRFQQGDVIVVSNGVLALTPRGTLTGELQLTVVNFAKLIPLLGIDRMVAQLVPQDTVNRLAPGLDRIVPGLGNLLRGGNSGRPGGAGHDNITSANASAAAVGAAALGGRQTEFEGQRAVTLVLRVDDGTVVLGPLKLGQIPPLY